MWGFSVVGSPLPGFAEMLRCRDISSAAERHRQACFPEGSMYLYSSYLGLKGVPI